MDELIFAVSFLVVILLVHCMYCVATVGHEIITVSDKNIFTTSSGHGDTLSVMSRHMVYTTDGQALINVNCIWFGKFKSDELQAKLKKGKTYKIKTSGIRVPFLGMHKNILSATPVEKNKH